MQATLPHGIPGNTPDAPKSDPREKLIVALDVSTAEAAQKIVVTVRDSALAYKVGMQLYTAGGPRVVRNLVASGRRVFLDLKYQDMPTTVAAAVHEAAKLGGSMLTVHAAGGGKMLHAAVDAARIANPALLVLGVTVLTSLDQNEMEKVGLQGTVREAVLHLSTLALDNGCKGIVTSDHETPALRARLGHNFAIVTPGVRPAGSRH